MRPDQFDDATTAKQIDSACDRFENAWREGRAISIEGLIQDQSEPLRSELLVELLQVEWGLRYENREPDTSTYLRRFPSDREIVHRALREWRPDDQQIRCPDCGLDYRVDTAAFPGHLCPSCGSRVTAPERTSDAIGDSGTSSAHGRFLPGTKLASRYRIVSLIGKGGMGEVYRADDLKLGQTVALKFLPKSLARNAHRLALFHNEVRLSRQISHPNVCRVYDISEVDGQPFLSMEFVDGEDLRSLLRRIGRLPKDKSTEIARQLFAALAAAHEVGVLHRDLKPANVMLDGRGRVKITDFGLAKAQQDIEQTTEYVGTPTYMAPEQLLRGETSKQSDVYALGALMYEILVGRPLHPRDLTALRHYHEHPTSAPTPSQLGADVDPSVERIVLQCLEKDPSHRPLSGAVVSALQSGDPWAELRAAGETPSPEMVAAAGGRTALAKNTATASVITVVAGLVLLAVLADHFTLFGRANPTDPTVLVHRDIPPLLAAFGCADHTDEPASGKIGYGFEFDEGVAEYVLVSDMSPQRWERLSNGQPPAVYFWYRQGPEPLVPTRFRRETRGLWYHRERVSENNPERYQKGMLAIRLDAEGKLLRFSHVPTEDNVRVPKKGSNNVIPLAFEKAGLNQLHFTAVASDPAKIPVMATDIHRWQENGETLLRTVDAATMEGRLVYFNVTFPKKAEKAATAESTERNKVFGLVVLVSILIPASLYLCLRNIRLGRGDQKTATVVAISLFLLGAVEWICLTSHANSIQAERDLVSSGLSAAVMFSIVTWIYYLAIEPYVRRYWPQALASWCRVFEGRVRDPLVGRDVLLGTLGGVVSMVFVASLVLAPPWLGYLPTVPYRHWDIDTLQQYIISPMAAVGGAASLLRLSMRVGIVSLLMLFLLRIILRNRWLAIGAFMGLAIAARVERVPIWYIVIIVAWVSPGLMLLVRYGLIACIMWFYTFFLLSMPLTASSRWYVGYGVFFLSIVFGCALYGYLTTMAGRPLVSDERLAGS